MLLIDVAFYLKCLQRYPTLFLCGPVSSKTPSCMHHIAGQHSVHNGLWFLKGQNMVGTARISRVILLIQEKHICSCGWYEETEGLAHKCSGQLCWCCQPGLPPVHLLQLIWRASEGLVHQRRGWMDQEQVLRGQPGVLHLISSPVQINLLW